jgi:hypothetical protein
MMAVTVKAASGSRPSFEPGAPAPLFDAHMARGPTDSLVEYDVTADGERFLVNTTGGVGSEAAPPLTVVVNWNAGSRIDP